MSSRALRRLERLKNEENKEQESVPLREELATSRKRANAFALLNTNDIDDEENDDTESIDIPTEEKLEEDDRIKPVKIASKKSKKKDKRKRSAMKKTNQPDDFDDSELDKYLAEMELQDFKNLQILSEDEDEDTEHYQYPLESYSPGGKALTPKRFKSCLHLLQCNPTNLDPDKEFEQLFGQLSKEVLEDADSSSAAFVTPELLKSIKLASKRVRGWSGRDRRSAPGISRKLILTKIRDDWIPVLKKPLSMEEMAAHELQKLFESRSDDWKDVIKKDIAQESAIGIKYFKMTETSQNRLPNTQFYISVVIRPDHESLIQLLRSNPYHLQTILQVTSILQRQGDNSNSNGLIERALFLFDWSLKQSFSLGSGLCRLPFEFFLNRQIYLTLFRYITVLGTKGTFFTALNYCKLLLSFDPTDDPYGVRYFIDYYACLSEEYKFLIDFVESPLVSTYKEWFTPSLAYSVALAYLRTDNLTKAKEAIRKAWVLYPFTGSKLLESLGLKSSPYGKKVSPVLELNTAMYVVRASSLWDDSLSREFLQSELCNLGDFKVEEQANEFPINLLRHVILSNETSAMAKIPSSFWENHEIFEFDVLPPKVGDKIFDFIDENRVGDAMIFQSIQEGEERQLAEVMANN